MSFELGGKRDLIFLAWDYHWTYCRSHSFFLFLFSTNYFCPLLQENMPYKHFMKSNDGLCFLFQNFLKVGNQQ